MGRNKIHPTPDDKIDELKRWYGWDNKMIAIVKRSRGIGGFHRIMIEEKNNGIQNAPAG